MTANEQVLNYLTNIPAWYLATCVEDQPHVRPFSFAAEFEGKIWFCTAKSKDVYEELSANPKFELSGWDPGHGWIVMRGIANLEDRVDAAVRRSGFEHMVGLGEAWTDENDPDLTFFSVDNPEAWICDIDGSKEELKF